MSGTGTFTLLGGVAGFAALWVLFGPFFPRVNKDLRGQGYGTNDGIVRERLVVCQISIDG